MRKIIDGIRYDTDKAVEIGTAKANEYSTDFHYWEETLYRTPRSGRYFIAGYGNAFSHWSRPAEGGGRGPGQGIRPVSEQQAFDWAQENLDPELVESKMLREGKAMKKLAALVDGKYIVGYTYTAAKNGDVVSYGDLISENGPLHQVGRAKVSRNKRLLRDIEKNYTEYAVNYGGGPAI